MPPSTVRADLRKMTEKYVIELVDVSKNFGEVVAVDRVSLNVRQGEFLTLLGPSGCGKSTTLRLIGGFEIPDTGKIYIQGKDYSALPPAELPTSMVFQDFALFPHMTVYDNIAFGLKMRGFKNNEIKQKTMEALKLVGLPDLGGRNPSQLSGGQKQRVALARSLILQPTVLLLDEPLGALDAQIRKTMQFELKNIQERLGQTFVYVTHDQEEAMTMSDQVAIMRNGKIEQLSNPEEIYEFPSTPFVASFLGECNLLEGLYTEDLGTMGIFKQPNLGPLQGQLNKFRSLGLNSPAIYCLRPENISVKPLSSAQNESSRVALHGIIKQRVYRGAVTRYLVEINKQELTAETLGKGDLADGDPVIASWDFKNAIILPAEELDAVDEVDNVNVSF